MTDIRQELEEDPATGRDEDYADYWRSRPNLAEMDTETTVQIIGDRCVYLNDYRIAGGKPYYSENLPNRHFKITVREALAAFPDNVLKAALKERKQTRAYFKRWHDAAARLKAKEQADG